MNLHAAIQLQSADYPVIPLVYGEKRPAFKGWNARAPLTRFEVQHHFRRRIYNLGIDLRQGLLVADCDTPEMLGEVLDRFGTTPAIAKTSRGFHAYYRRTFEMGNKIHFEGKPLDLLTQYAVAPPSWITKTDFRYEWVKFAEAGALPEFPKPEAPPRIVTSGVRIKGTYQKERARRYIAKIESIEGRGGDSALFKVACAVCQKFGLDEATALALIQEWNETNAQPPWGMDRLRYKVSQALKLKT